MTERSKNPMTRPGRKSGATNLKTKFPEDMRLDSETKEEWLLRKQRNSVYRHRAANKEKVDARRRELYAQNGPGDAKLAWRAANADKVRAYSKADFERNREEKLANLRAWNKANPEKARAASKRWAEANPERVRTLVAAGQARYRARARDATPLWVDWRAIWRIYDQAKRTSKKTGVPHQVDHIVPLNGKTVSGLHVPWNLRVITAAENRLKWCHLAEDDALEALYLSTSPPLADAA